MSWWCISSDSLKEMLERVATGEDPWVVYTEYYANSEHEHPEGGDNAADAQSA